MDYSERVKDYARRLLLACDDFAPSYAAELSQEEFRCACLYIIHSGDHFKVAAEMQVNVREVSGLTTTDHFRVALSSLTLAAGATTAESIDGMRPAFFTRLLELMNSSKDRTRIEGLRIFSGLLEKLEGGKFIRASTSSAMSGTVELGSLSNAELTAEIARQARTLH